MKALDHLDLIVKRCSGPPRPPPFRVVAGATLSCLPGTLTHFATLYAPLRASYDPHEHLWAQLYLFYALQLSRRRARTVPSVYRCAYNVRSSFVRA